MYIYTHIYIYILDFPGVSVVNNLPAGTIGDRRHGFNPWVRKIPWRRKWQSTPTFLPVKSHGERTYGITKSQTRLKRLSNHIHKYAFALNWLI